MSRKQKVTICCCGVQMRCKADPCCCCCSGKVTLSTCSRVVQKGGGQAGLGAELEMFLYGYHPKGFLSNGNGVSYSSTINQWAPSQNVLTLHKMLASLQSRLPMTWKLGPWCHSLLTGSCYNCFCSIAPSKCVHAFTVKSIWGRTVKSNVGVVVLILGSYWG